MIKITRRIVIFIAIAALLLLAMTADITKPEAQKGGTIKGVVKNRWVANFPIALYIDEMPDKKFAPPEKHPIADQKGKVFVPRVLPVLVGSSVDFHNSDNFEHNVFSPDGEKYNLGNWGMGQKRSYTFKTSGVYTQLCKLHPEMISYVLVVKTPYFAVSDKEGNFKIESVPSGTWKLKAWGERLKKAQLDKTYEVKVEEGKEAVIEIQP